MKYGIVHQFVNVAFKFGRRLSSLVGTEIDVGFDARMLDKFYNAMSACKLHSQTSVKFQLNEMGHVFRFAVQIGYKFFVQDMLFQKIPGVRESMSLVMVTFSERGVVVMKFV